MIPKIIHYVWIGNSPKSEPIENCINSWKKTLPDYQIIEWDNKRFEEIENTYAKQAFDCKKWAFASDYIRLYAIQKYGGFYFDTDLEITNNIEQFRKHRFVTGLELYKGKTSPLSAFIGCDPENPIISALLADYSRLEFIKENGELDLTPNTKRISDYLLREFNIEEPITPNQTIVLDENSYIYPYYYFCTPLQGKENYSIHHFNGSWLDGYARKNLLETKTFKVAATKKTINNPKSLPINPREKLILHIPVTKTIGLLLIKKNRQND